MPIRVDDFAEYEKTYSDQLNSQIEQVAASLMHLDKLMVAGLVDRRILQVLREAVDRVRTTGWVVQQTLDNRNANVSEVLLTERIRAAVRLLTQLSGELEARGGDQVEGATELEALARRLLSALGDEQA